MKAQFTSGLFLLVFAAPLYAEPTPLATARYESYIASTELRLDQQHRSPDSFLAGLTPLTGERLRAGQLLLERLSPTQTPESSGALLHDWRGTAFAAGASAADLERLLRDFGDYSRRYGPQVLTARVLSQHGDRLQAEMRVRQKHVLTVVMDTAYDVRFGRLDSRHGYSRSTSTRVAEIASPGTSAERVLGPSEEHGFLWRLNTYWTYEERDGGLYLQIESVSLSRSIPRGLAWAVAPFVESVPRESLEFTLRATCNALAAR